MYTKPFLLYNYVGEYASVLFAVLILMVIFYSKPRNTYVFRYVFAGLISSAISSVLQISILVAANNPERYYNKYLFMGQVVLFLISYNITLYFVFSYVNMLSLIRRSQRKEFLSMYAVLSVVYVTGALFEIFSGKICRMEEGGIDVTHLIRYYSCAGIVCAVICFITTVINRNNLSRIVWTTVYAVVPIEIALLTAQILVVERTHVVFAGLSYAIVFVLAHLLFHAETYDEVSGCQGQSALDEYITRHSGGKPYYLIYVFFSFPAAGTVEDNVKMGLKGISACRAIESISRKIIMFQMSSERFVDIIENCEEKEARNYVNEIRGVFDNVKSDIDLPFNYVLIAGKVDGELDSPILVRQFFEFIAARYTDQNSSHYYVATEEDREQFRTFFEISNTLKEIRNEQNYDDRRIMVYAQPIYSVEAGAFRVAEALMRLDLNGKVISPDKFIPIAEQTGCIHVLSCIILNKVCRTIESLSAEYDFDAISINISSKELSDEKMYQDLLDIIEKYDIDVSRIRMEITETAMFENYEIANRNMEILNKEGIQLYLDDFGTGYSSLERVMDCPIMTIKFDKSILYKSLDDNRMDDILTYMIDVFKKNGFITLVEGVEDESQSRYSMDRGFDFIQGYHYAKPGPIEDLTKYFSHK